MNNLVLPTGAWELPEELVMLRDTVRQFMTNEVRPLEDTLEHDATGPSQDQLRQLQAKAQAIGLWSLQTPAEFGGAGLSILGQCVVQEEAAQCRSGAFFPALGAFGGNPPSVFYSASSAQFEKLHCELHRGFSQCSSVHLCDLTDLSDSWRD